MEDQLDPLYLALHNFRINHIEDAHKECNRVMERNPLDKAAWSLKLACFAEEVWVDELENDEAGLADTYMDISSTITTAARPGTSFSRPLTGAASGGGGLGTSPAMRPRSQTGRPLSGMARPDTGRLKTGNMEQALRTSRTSRTARPVSSMTARQARLGTASMLAQKDGPFVNLARLNVEKYAREKCINRYLFDYVFLHEGDMKLAHQIAAAATKAADYGDWFWKNQLGKCYYRLGMLHDAEKQFNSSLKNCKMVETYAYLAKVYRRLDQPLSAVERYNEGLKEFPHDLTLLVGLARIFEDLGQSHKSTTHYKLVLKQDASNVEAIACLATHFFYGGEAELALKLYRRILQMGVSTAELYLNLALCCFYCQQIDFALGCLEQAHARADDSIHADLWYNTAHLAMASGDLRMAERCLRITLASAPDHAESLCNLGVLRMQAGRTKEARTLFQSAIAKGDHLYEAHFNYALLLHEAGDYAQCHAELKRTLELFPDHYYSQRLLQRVETMFNS